jgi:hypothetical protein
MFYVYYVNLKPVFEMVHHQIIPVSKNCKTGDNEKSNKPYIYL